MTTKKTFRFPGRRTPVQEPQAAPEPAATKAALLELLHTIHPHAASNEFPPELAGIPAVIERTAAQLEAQPAAGDDWQQLLEHLTFCVNELDRAIELKLSLTARCAFVALQAANAFVLDGAPDCCKIPMETKNKFALGLQLLVSNAYHYDCCLQEYNTLLQHYTVQMQAVAKQKLQLQQELETDEGFACIDEFHNAQSDCHNSILSPETLRMIGKLLTYRQKGSAHTGMELTLNSLDTRCQNDRTTLAEIAHYLSIFHFLHGIRPSAAQKEVQRQLEELQHIMITASADPMEPGEEPPQQDQ